MRPLELPVLLGAPELIEITGRCQQPVAVGIQIGFRVHPELGVVVKNLRLAQLRLPHRLLNLGRSSEAIVAGCGGHQVGVRDGCAESGREMVIVTGGE